MSLGRSGEGIISGTSELFDDVAKAGNYTILSGDKGKTFLCTTTMTLTLPSATDKFWFTVYNNGTGIVTVGTVTRLLPGEWCEAASEGSGWFLLARGLDVPIGHPDRPPLTANAVDDECRGPSLDAKWTWVNQGTATATLNHSGLLIAAPATSGNTFRGVSQAISGNWKIRAKVSGVQLAAFATNFGGAGIFCSRSGSNICTYNVGMGASAFYHAVEKWTSTTTFASTTKSTTDNALYAIWVYLELEYDGTNIIARISKTGEDGTFQFFNSVSATTQIGGAPDAVGIYVYVANATVAFSGLWSWFRRVA